MVSVLAWTVLPQRTGDNGGVWSRVAVQEVVRVLLHHSADVNARDKNWQTPLHVAAANNAIQCAEVIIPLLSSVNVSDRGGRTALHHAALNGHREVLQRVSVRQSTGEVRICALL